MSLNEVVIIRVEASNAIGFGHMVRCFALADELSMHARVVFVTKSDSVITACKERGLNCFLFKKDVDAIKYLRKNNHSHINFRIVIDTKSNYTLREVSELQSECLGIYFIENTSPGTMHADRIIYPAAHFDYDSVYGSLDFSLPPERLIYGEEFVIIRKELKEYANHSDGGLVVTTGASDPCGVMLELDKVIASLGIKANFLIGEKFDFILKESGRVFGSKYLNYDYKLIANAETVISTFGVSVYESIFLKKPTISIAHSYENAFGSRMLAEKLDMVEDLGYYKDLNPSQLQLALDRVSQVEQPQNSFKIDVKGAMRISKIILGYD